jgi:hypothetical protein
VKDYKSKSLRIERKTLFDKIKEVLTFCLIMGGIMYGLTFLYLCTTN